MKRKLFNVLPVMVFVAVVVQGIAVAKNSGKIELKKATDSTNVASAPAENRQVLFSNDWNPFAEMERLQAEMNRFFDDSFNHLRAFQAFGEMESLPFSPQLDLEDKGDSYEVRLNLPGAKKPDISVEISDSVLTISGKIEENIEKKEQGILRRERRSGQFSRAIVLPGPVDVEAMDAHYENGVLVVTAPKEKVEKKVHKVEVK